VEDKAAEAAAQAVGRAEWAVPRPPGRAAIASAPIAGIERRIRWANLVINKNAPSVARRWRVSKR